MAALLCCGEIAQPVIQRLKVYFSQYVVLEEEFLYVLFEQHLYNILHAISLFIPQHSGMLNTN